MCLEDMYLQSFLDGFSLENMPGMDGERSHIPWYIMDATYLRGGDYSYYNLYSGSVKGIEKVKISAVNV